MENKTQLRVMSNREVIEASKRTKTVTLRFQLKHVIKAEEK